MTAEQCHICGKSASYTCNLCLRPVCAEHYLDSEQDNWAGACQQCLEETDQHAGEDRLADDARFPPYSELSGNLDSSYVPPIVINEYLVQTGETDPSAAAQPPGSHPDNFVQRLFGRVGRRPAAASSDVDLHLRGLLNQHQDRVFTYLGRPQQVADLSKRGGALSGQESYHLEYHAKGLRFYRRARPEILSIHFIHSGFGKFQTYPREILPGLRVGMTRREIDALLGLPDGADSKSKWKSYAAEALPPPIGNLEVFYADGDDPDAASIIIAIG